MFRLGSNISLGCESTHGETVIYLDMDMFVHILSSSDTLIMGNFGKLPVSNSIESDSNMDSNKPHSEALENSKDVDETKTIDSIKSIGSSFFSKFNGKTASQNVSLYHPKADILSETATNESDDNNTDDSTCKYHDEEEHEQNIEEAQVETKCETESYENTECENDSAENTEMQHDIDANTNAEIPSETKAESATETDTLTAYVESKSERKPAYKPNATNGKIPADIEAEIKDASRMVKNIAVICEDYSMPEKQMAVYKSFVQLASKAIVDIQKTCDLKWKSNHDIERAHFDLYNYIVTRYEDGTFWEDPISDITTMAHDILKSYTTK